MNVCFSTPKQNYDSREGRHRLSEHTISVVVPCLWVSLESLHNVILSAILQLFWRFLYLSVILLVTLALITSVKFSHVVTFPHAEYQLPPQAPALTTCTPRRGDMGQPGETWPKALKIVHGCCPFAPLTFHASTVTVVVDKWNGQIGPLLFPCTVW